MFYFCFFFLPVISFQRWIEWRPTGRVSSFSCRTLGFWWVGPAFCCLHFSNMNSNSKRSVHLPHSIWRADYFLLHSIDASITFCRQMNGLNRKLLSEERLLNFSCLLILMVYIFQTFIILILYVVERHKTILGNWGRQWITCTTGVYRQNIWWEKLFETSSTYHWRGHL